jgi:hypothetical protein
MALRFELCPVSFRLSLLFILGLSFLIGSPVNTYSQETRGSIFGVVRDSTGAVVPGASVEIRSNDTNVATQVVTNESGAYEVPFLVPGSYNVSATAKGFKNFVQQGVQLPVGERVSVDIALEIGSVDEQVVVTADAPLLETDTGSATSSLDNRQIMNLPVFGNNTVLLTRAMPGTQWNGPPNYVGQHSTIAASETGAGGGVGGNEYTIDGVPNAGNGRRPASMPFSDTVAELKVETSPFDASKGHTSNAGINLLTKSGGNEYHGSLTWQHWQQRWNGTPTAINAARAQAIDALEQSGDFAGAARLRAEPKQASGRSHNFAGTVGGPVRFPRFGEGGPMTWSGKDKLFFFFSYSGVRDQKSEEPDRILMTVPTLRQRMGDFSDLPNDPRYTIYDPRTARLVNGRVTRSPIADRSRVPILNPLARYYSSIMPLPNRQGNDDGTDNYIATAMPNNWNYDAFSNRWDWQIRDNNKMFVRWSWNDFIEDRLDYTYTTLPGLHSNNQNRRNWSVTIDDVHTINPTTYLNVSVGYNRYREGNIMNEVQRSFTASGVGLPSYIDEKAGINNQLPTMSFSAYPSIGRNFGLSHFSVGTLRSELQKIAGNHSIKIGGEGRINWRAFGSPGSTTGEYSFRNTYLSPRQGATGNETTNVGLEWAAFLMGVPSGISIDTNASGYTTNRSYAGYIHDDWRVSPRLTLNLGLRYEFEGGISERYNRGLAQFDPNAVLPISTGAVQAYARNPLPDLPVSEFQVRGGATYLGVNGTPRTLNEGKGEFMPRIGFAYKLNDRTVVRGGYGMYYDTINVLVENINQSGYSRGTTTTLTTDNGLNFLGTNLTSADCQSATTDTAGRCRTIFADPFPIRPDGTRFNVPLGNSLGVMAMAGRSFTYPDRDWERARVQRWRLGVQRELGKNTVVEVSYLGSYADQITLTKNLNALPAEYYASGTNLNREHINSLTRTVPNPFYYRNFDSFATSNPVLYQDMASNGFFNSPTVQRHQLLRPFPHMSGLNNSRVPDGKKWYYQGEISLQRRFSDGLSYMVSYTAAYGKEKDFYENEFDDQPSWRVADGSRPHHLRVLGDYDLPFGRKFWNENRLAKSILGNWTISGIYHLASGPMLSLGNYVYYGNNLRDIKLPDSERTTDQWFDWRQFPAANRDFTDPKLSPAQRRAAYTARIREIVPAQFLPSGKTYETVVPSDFLFNGSFHRRIFPTRLNFLRQDIMTQLDFNVIRRFPISESVRFEVATQFINLFNSVQWDTPNMNIGSSGFGTVSTQINTPRWIQFQGRLYF